MNGAAPKGRASESTTTHSQDIANDQEQLDLDLYQLRLTDAVRDAGQDAARRGDPDAFDHDKGILEMLAGRGGHFDSDDAHEWGAYGGPALGAAFSALAKAGVIESVGFKRSRRTQGHGRYVQRWTGAGLAP